MPSTQVKSTTSVSVATKVVVAALVLTGLGALGYAAGAIPSSGTSDLTVSVGIPYGGRIFPEDDFSVDVVAMNTGSKAVKKAEFVLAHPAGQLRRSGYSTGGSAGVKCRDTVPGVEGGTTCFADIAAGGSVTISVGFAAYSEVYEELGLPACGAHITVQLRAIIDGNNKIKETNELNNMTSPSFMLLPPACAADTTMSPDITITSSTSVDPVPYKGSLLNVFTVSNMGTVDSGEFTVNFEYPGSDWLTPTWFSSSDFTCVNSGSSATDCTGSLSPGKSTEFRFISTNNAGYGAIACDGTKQVGVLAKVDSESDIVELSEANNSNTLVVNLLGPTGTSCL